MSILSFAPGQEGQLERRQPHTTRAASLNKYPTAFLLAGRELRSLTRDGGRVYMQLCIKGAHLAADLF
jgi:hypothetical protein